MRIYAVFGDNAVMIEYSYEHARYCLHKYFRGAHYTKAFGSIAEEAVVADLQVFDFPLCHQGSQSCLADPGNLCHHTGRHQHREQFRRVRFHFLGHGYSPWVFRGSLLAK